MVLKDTTSKNPSQKIGLVEWLKVKDPSSNPRTAKNKKQNKQIKKTISYVYTYRRITKEFITKGGL
jgi:hypothetical protein